MYRHILIPHDGFELSAKAVAHGIALAKSVDAKVTGLTVTAPFQVISIKPEMITDLPEQYAKRAMAIATKNLNQVREIGLAAGVHCDVLHMEHDQPYRAYYRRSHQTEL